MQIHRGFDPILLADYWAPPHTTDVKVLCNAAALLGVPFQTLCICLQENSNFNHFLELNIIMPLPYMAQNYQKCLVLTKPFLYYYQIITYFQPCTDHLKLLKSQPSIKLIVLSFEFLTFFNLCLNFP